MAEPIISETHGRACTDAMVNGALITLGSLGTADNIVIHWVLGWHRLVRAPLTPFISRSPKRGLGSRAILAPDWCRETSSRRQNEFETLPPSPV
jgi:hypothetical protein